MAGMPSAKIKLNFIMISIILIELEKFEAAATPVQCYYSLILVAAMLFWVGSFDSMVHVLIITERV